MLKFLEKKENGLLGITTVLTCADEQGEKAGDFQIRADKGGIRFVGESPRFDDMVQLNEFAKAVDRAWRAHRVYKPKITNAAGH